MNFHVKVETFTRSERQNFINYAMALQFFNEQTARKRTHCWVGIFNARNVVVLEHNSSC